ncbi:PREDICTED: uncharacterized protein LOC105363143 [Ceratosolen solmsi marchali]|uniref:Uncharacterized protein LOC105363143 n=1 Tax=Ceratosolen solmsi marchali TaxID=326594 RepID=A0AAJ6YJ70_9HYME|nr:PREDICTED: uncharacterized protein LOC105363143 [Ceratosolen solmsi marchali]
MIEDQEILVSSLSQQGISEPLIRRHFERLLEEQSKQLLMLNENRLVEQKKSKIDLFKFKKQNQKRNNYETQEKSYSVNYNSAQAIDKPNCACASKITVNAAQSNQEQQQCVRNNEEESKMIFDSQENNRPHKVEPSSLMKIRLQREVVNTQRRNNGLQNDTVALEIIQNCKNDKDKHVPVNHSNDSVYVRLNGTQDKLALENYQSIYATETLKKQEKRTPYNGLENIRNSDNPQLAPKSLKCRAQQLLNEQTGVSYPPQKSYPHYSTPVTNSSNDNGKYSEQYSNDADSQSQYENEAQLQPPNDVCHNECNSPHCTNQSNLTYWPEFQEPKIIGGLTYFARKPQSIPNQKNLNVENHKCSSSEKFYVS